MKDRISVLWLRRSGTGTWLAYYSPPLEDEPILLTEAYTADDAVREGLDRLRRLEIRDA